MKQVDEHRQIIESLKKQVLDIAIDRADWMKKYGIALAVICKLEGQLEIPNGKTIKEMKGKSK